MSGFEGRADRRDCGDEVALVQLWRARIHLPMFMSRHDFPTVSLTGKYRRDPAFASFTVDATDLAIHRKASECLIVAQMRSANRIGQRPLLGAKRKTFAQTECFRL